jgi:hypothetical protein
MVIENEPKPKLASLAEVLMPELVLPDVSGPNHRPTRYPSSAAKSSDHLSSDAAGILFRDFTDDRRFTIFSRHQLTISLT